MSELATVRRVDAGTRAQRRRGRFARLRRPGAEVVARERAPEMRRTCAAVYRAFAAFLGPQATAEGLTPEAVRAYRDRLERAGRSRPPSPSTSPHSAISPPRSAPTRP